MKIKVWDLEFSTWDLNFTLIDYRLSTKSINCKLNFDIDTK